MPFQTSLAAPRFVPITLDADLGRKTLRGIDVFAAGDLQLTDIEGNQVTITFPTVANGGSYPKRYVAQIKSVDSDETTIAASNLLGLI